MAKTIGRASCQNKARVSWGSGQMGCFCSAVILLFVQPLKPAQVTDLSCQGSRALAQRSSEETALRPEQTQHEADRDLVLGVICSRPASQARDELPSTPS